MRPWLVVAAQVDAIPLTIVCGVLQVLPRRGGEADAELRAARRVEVVGQAQLCAGARGGLVHGQAGDEVVDSAVLL
jgi:hypothetical protein